jgi:hypothetical protein
VQSKRRIEQQLAHFKTDCESAHDPAIAQEIAGWVKALEWVLGDEDHRAAYATFIAELEKTASLPRDEATTRERVLSLTLSMALERLA